MGGSLAGEARAAGYIEEASGSTRGTGIRAEAGATPTPWAPDLILQTAFFAARRGAVVVTDAPDATSGLVCNATEVAVGAQATCTITPRRGGAGIQALATAFGPSTSTGTVSALTPSVGDTLTFTFIAITVTDAPDGTSGFVCGATLLDVGQPTLYTITPRKAGAGIIARASAFTPSASAGAVGALSPSVGPSFTFTYTAPATSGAVIVDDGLTSFGITVTAAPDGTSGFVCGATLLDVGQQTVCTITPRKAGVAITARASAFTASASSGAVGAVAPSAGASLTFTYTAPATSGAVTVGDGFATVGVTVTDTPDATSGLACSPASVPTTQQSVCTITPRRAGAAITARASAFTLTATAGTVNGLAPAVGTSLTFTFMAPASAQAVTVGSGVNTVVVFVSVSCSDGVTNGKRPTWTAAARAARARSGSTADRGPIAPRSTVVAGRAPTPRAASPSS